MDDLVPIAFICYLFYVSCACYFDLLYIYYFYFVIHWVLCSFLILSYLSPIGSVVYVRLGLEWLTSIMFVAHVALSARHSFITLVIQSNRFVYLSLDSNWFCPVSGRFVIFVSHMALCARQAFVTLVMLSNIFTYFKLRVQLILPHEQSIRNVCIYVRIVCR